MSDENLKYSFVVREDADSIANELNNSGTRAGPGAHVSMVPGKPPAFTCWYVSNSASKGYKWTAQKTKYANEGAAQAVADLFSGKDPGHVMVCLDQTGSWQVWLYEQG